MAYVGGLRARLIKDSLYDMINDSLRSVGWFDGGRHHKEVTVINEPIPESEEAEPNKVAVSMEGVTQIGLEMGSDYSEHPWICFIDIYAENEALGIHLGTDVRDIIAGRFSSIGRDRPILDVYDLSQATPPHIFTVHIEDIEMERNRNNRKHWQKYWWTIAFNLIDDYDDEDD